MDDENLSEYDRLRVERDEALDSLRELVELDNEPHPHGHSSEECGTWQDDYRERYDAAWNRAEALVERTSRDVPIFCPRCDDFTADRHRQGAE